MVQGLETLHKNKTDKSMKVTKSFGLIILFPLGFTLAYMAHDGLKAMGYDERLAFGLALPAAAFAVYLAHLFRHTANQLYLWFAVLFVAALAYFDATACFSTLQDNHVKPGAEDAAKADAYTPRIAEARNLIGLAEADAAQAKADADAERLGTNGGKAGIGAAWRALDEIRQAKDADVLRLRADLRNLLDEQTDARARAESKKAIANPLAAVSFWWLFVGFLVLEAGVAVGGWGLTEGDPKATPAPGATTVNVITPAQPTAPDDGGDKVSLEFLRRVGLDGFRIPEGADPQEALRLFMQARSKEWYREKTRATA